MRRFNFQKIFGNYGNPQCGNRWVADEHSQRSTKVVGGLNGVLKELGY